MPALHKTLGIPSQEEADELEQDLGIRFDDLTDDQRETWKQQTVYLGLYAQTRTFTHAARAAGVSIRKVRSWQAENTLGFNRRLEYAVLEYTEEIHLMLLRHARKPDCPPSLLMMFLRSQMPEKYGPARRETAPHATPCDHHDDPVPDTSQHDHAPLNDIPRDIHDLKQFAGLTEPPALFPLPFAGEGQGEGEDVRPEPVEGPNPDSQSTHTPISAPSPVIPANAGIHPPTPSTPNPPALSTQNPAPVLNRRQRRQLQRQQRKQSKHAPSPETGTKQPNSHRPRAPN